MPTFQHGKSTGVLFDEFDLSSFFNQANASRAIQAVNTTTFGNDDKVYIAGVESGSISIQGLWDGSAAAADEVLDGAIGAESIITVAPQGLAVLGNKTIMLKGENVSYQIRSSANDAVRIVAGGMADGGVRTAGVLLQPLEAETTTFDGTSVDNGASSAFGGVGHIHVTVFSGTSATVKIQDSANDVAWADLITFADITGVVSERLTVAGTVDQFLRFAITADTFTSMTIACSFARNRR
jgi:hypothetical protein